MLSSEIWKIFKNNYFDENLWTTASNLYLKTDSNTDIFKWILWIMKRAPILQSIVEQLVLKHQFWGLSLI